MEHLASLAGSHYFCRRGDYRLIVGPSSHAASWFFIVSKIGDKGVWVSWDRNQILDQKAAKNVALKILESQLESQGQAQSADAEAPEWLKVPACGMTVADLRARVWRLSGDEAPGFFAVWQGSELNPFVIDWLPSVDDAKARAGDHIRINLQSRGLTGAASAGPDHWVWRAL